MQRLAKRTQKILNYDDAPGALGPSHTFRIRHYNAKDKEYHPEHTDWFKTDHSTLIASAMLVLETPEKGGMWVCLPRVLPLRLCALPT